MSAAASSNIPGPIALCSASRRLDALALGFTIRKGCSAGRDDFAPASGLGQQHLHVAESTLGKSTLTTAQIEFPQADELVAKTELADRRELFEKIPTPLRQGARIVRPDVLQVEYFQIGDAAQRFGYRTDRRNEAAGKHIALYEVDRAQLRAVILVLDGNGLQQHRAAVAQQRCALGEIGVKVRCAHCLDHLHRSQLVVLALE